MKFSNRVGSFALVLGLALASLPAGAQTQHSLTAGSGGQTQIGGGLPLPIQLFEGGTALSTAGDFPDLLIPPSAGVLIDQSATGAITVPANALAVDADSVLQAPTFLNNPAIFQVNTAIDYAWPVADATFAPGGGPAAGAGIFIGAGPNGGNVTYSNTGAAFGGPALFSLTPGAPAALGAIPGSPVTVYINFMAQLPGTATGAALVGAGLNPVVGASTAAGTISTPGAAADPGFMGGAFGPGGTVLASMQCVSPCPFVPNVILGDRGFPWTTGVITVSAPNADPAEIFFLSGDDTRPGGVGTGTISMVSSTVSDRSLSGPNANRAWVRLVLPEPSAAMAAMGAFAMLGICHTAVRGRSRRS